MIPRSCLHSVCVMVETCRATAWLFLHPYFMCLICLTCVFLADQGKISEILGSIFGIRTGFYGKIVSNLARVRNTFLQSIAASVHFITRFEDD